MAISIEPVESCDIWERFVFEHAPGALFQSWLWGEVERKQGHSVWRFGVYDGEHLIAVFQVFKVLAKRGTFLHVRHGPILTSQTTFQWQSVIAFLKDLGSRERVWFIRVSPQVADSQTHRELLRSFDMRPAAIHAMDGEHCWVLDLDKTEDELLAQMRKTTRYEIRQAQKLGVVVEKSVNPVSLESFDKLYEVTYRRHGFVPHEGIREEFETFARINQAILLTGKLKGKILSSSIILFYNQQGIYHHGASIQTKIPASYLVQWEAIREAKKRGMKVYNFWGIAPEDRPNHPWRGITLFKKGFGGREVSYIHAHDLPLSPAYQVSRTIEIARKIIRGL